MTARIRGTILLVLMNVTSCWETSASQAKTPVVAEEAKPDGTLAGRMAALKEEFEAWEKSLSGELEAVRKVYAKGSEARSKAVIEVIAKSQRDWQVIADQVIASIKGRPADSAALDGVLMLGATVDDDLLEVARRHFLDDPRIGRLCASLPGRWAGSTTSFLSEVADSHPDRQIRGQATYALGEYTLGLFRTLTSTEDRRVKDSDLERMLPETQKKFYKQMISGRRLTGSERERMLAEAAKYFDQVTKGYPDVRSVYGTFLLSEKAKAELAWIANVPGQEIGKLAPEIVGEDLDGKPLDLKGHRGKVVVLCFWATWCGPCMEMVPHERELVKRLEGKPFALLGINSDESTNREKARQTAIEGRMTWPSFWDGGVDGPIQARFNVQGYPTIYVLDAKGVIRSINVWGKDLDRAVESLLVELETGEIVK